MHTTVLFCTVGGSHQPIVTAIRDTQPTYVVFLCTDRDPATGQPGSRVQVEGKGNVIKARREDPGATLPNIPAQTGLAPDAFEVQTVAADDLDNVVAQALLAMTDLRARFPGARLLADYTGGTKTMTAGLVMATLECDDVELRLVTGARGNLEQVHEGSQRSVQATVEEVRLRRAMAPFLAAWARHGYAEAAQGLSSLPTPRSSRLLAELQIARELSAALDAWDRFDHIQALSTLAMYGPRIGQRAGTYRTFLQMLTAPDDDPRREPAQLLDLWLNALRRAAQGRYDDAVARTYRLLEWTAQWLLRDQVGIDTGDVPLERIPEGMTLSQNRAGRWQAGLAAAWQLVAAHVEGPAQTFAVAESGRMLDHLTTRNGSILAHGYTPVTEGDWQRFRAWTEDAFLPMLQLAAAAKGIRLQPAQLPAEPVWDSWMR